MEKLSKESFGSQVYIENQYDPTHGLVDTWELLQT